ncbi:carbohydrate kinase family protein [Pyrococcus abyssi]|uniref:Carbohydrate kinase, PfkB family n=1 Tax=Pyrococcus abyssi (strain GE5 / Orsay) TaxID=272844 RepID=Q9V145_PYRAB|nr:PfkB family carbohydrate kinase [Pyrococcus abyssi]CAB49506.1 Carbohydrate kinase, PfkB family [Pyrococcus abyssi GE5]CCE69976.1 TPA: hypothetical protein PAB1967 [Pyrococcus abyssi GE5]
MKFAIIGNLTIDIVNGKKKPGGGAYYSGLILSKHTGVTIYTKIGDDYPKKWLEEISSYAEVVAFKGSSTTMYELFYSGEGRVIKALSPGDKISADELSTISEEKVIINPVAGEIGEGDVLIFKKPCLDLQGFVRELRKDGLVTLKEIDGEFLENASIVHSSTEEFRMVKNLKLPDVLAVTNGSEEGVVITRKGKITFKPRKVDVKDPTGAGDAFLALLSYGINRYNELKRALEFALDETAKFLKLGLRSYLEDRDDEASIG